MCSYFFLLTLTVVLILSLLTLLLIVVLFVHVYIRHSLLILVARRRSLLGIAHHSLSTHPHLSKRRKRKNIKDPAMPSKGTYRSYVISLCLSLNLTDSLSLS